MTEMFSKTFFTEGVCMKRCLEMIKEEFRKILAVLSIEEIVGNPAIGRRAETIFGLLEKLA